MKIMIDLDRVVFDCPSFTSWLGNLIFTKTTPNKKLKYSIVDKVLAKKHQNPLFFLKSTHSENFEPIDNSIEILKLWNTQGFDIDFVSSRPNLYSLQKATVLWLENNNIEYNNLIFACTNKAKYCKENDIDIIIDDTTDNCINSANLGITAIQLLNAYNKKTIKNTNKIHLANNWNNINDFVQNYSQEK